MRIRFLFMTLLMFSAAGCSPKYGAKPSSPGQRSMIFHQVEPGDTLSAIAAHYTGRSAHWRQLVRPSGLSNERKLQVGERVGIPYALVRCCNGGSTSPAPVASMDRGSVRQIKTRKSRKRKEPAPTATLAVEKHENVVPVEPLPVAAAATADRDWSETGVSPREEQLERERLTEELLRPMIDVSEQSESVDGGTDDW